jgi:hypothetical protein
MLLNPRRFLSAQFHYSLAQDAAWQNLTSDSKQERALSYYAVQHTQTKKNFYEFKKVKQTWE